MFKFIIYTFSLSAFCLLYLTKLLLSKSIFANSYGDIPFFPTKNCAIFSADKVSNSYSAYAFLFLEVLGNFLYSALSLSISF